MVRFIFLVGFMFLVTASALALRACLGTEAPAESAAELAIADNIAVLEDGETIFAPDGSITRVLTDWLANPAAKARVFELGGEQFTPGSIAPVPAVTPRLARLATMLRSYPRVNARFIGHTNPSGNYAADLALSQARADLAVSRLAAAGVDPARLSAQGVGSDGPLHPAGSAQAGRNDRVVLELGTD